MFVKPAPGVKVRDPVSKTHLPESGREVPDTDPFWHRRLRSGDVVLAVAPAAEPSAESAAVAPRAATPVARSSAPPRKVHTSATPDKE
jgi:hypothetical protein